MGFFEGLKFLHDISKASSKLIFASRPKPSTLEYVYTSIRAWVERVSVRPVSSFRQVCFGRQAASQVCGLGGDNSKRCRFRGTFVHSVD